MVTCQYPEMIPSTQVGSFRYRCSEGPMRDLLSGTTVWDAGSREHETTRRSLGPSLTQQEKLLKQRHKAQCQGKSLCWCSASAVKRTTCRYQGDRWQPRNCLG